MTGPPDAVQFELFVSSFCGACQQTRTILEKAIRFVPDASIVEHDVAFEPDRAEAAGIDATPTVIVRTADGTEVLRATGVPTVDQVLNAAVRALDSASH